MLSKFEVKGPFGLVLLAAIMIFLSGCRASPTLVETIYDDSAEVIDEENQMKSLQNDEENDDKDENISPKDFENLFDNPRERERQNPVPGEETSEDSAPNIDYDENANSQYDAENQNTGTGTEDSGGSIGVPNSPSNDTDGGPNSNNDKTMRQVVDGNGNVVDIPKQVETVSAVGEAGVIVQMLGGGDRLVATSESMSQGLAGSVFERSSGTGLWSGSGNTPLSESKFTQLVESAPQICFEISGQATFSSEQISELNNNDIAYVVLPPLDSGSNICQAVYIVGQVLGESEGTDAPAKAEEYRNYYNNTLNAVGNLTDTFSPDGINYDTRETVGRLDSDSGIYTLFLNTWDSDAVYRLNYGGVEPLKSGQGLAVAQSGYGDLPVNYFLSVAGIANSAALKENNYSLNESKLLHISPIRSNNTTFTISGGRSAVSTNYGSAYVLTTAGSYNLGDSKFPCIIVANSTMKDAIMRDALWENYGLIQSGSGLTIDYGFTHKGDIIVTTIHDDYDIYVMPSGVGSWSDGSVESVLISVWAAGTVKDLMSEDNVRGYISDFYQRFYNFTPNQQQMSQILAGN